MNDIDPDARGQTWGLVIVIGTLLLFCLVAFPFMGKKLGQPFNGIARDMPAGWLCDSSGRGKRCMRYVHPPGNTPQNPEKIPMDTVVKPNN